MSTETSTETITITATGTTVTRKILAWHGDPGLKAEVMERLRDHRKQDEFIQGHYQLLDSMAVGGYRGCAIGCTLPALQRLPHGNEHNWHYQVERLYGIDRRIAVAIDYVFESLPLRNAGDFAVNVVEAVPVGADLDNVADGWRQFKRAADINPEIAAARLIECLHKAPVPTPVLRRQRGVLIPA